MINIYQYPLIAAIVTAVTTFSATSNAELLRPGQSITVNQRFYGDFNLHFATLQDSGNLIVVGNDGRITWSSNTAGSGAAQLIMQGDGNLVLYSGQGRPVWSTSTWGPDRVFGIDPAGKLMVVKPTKKNRTRYLNATRTFELFTAGGVMEWHTPATSFPPPRGH
jgi:hypothetical protein